MQQNIIAEWTPYFTTPQEQAILHAIVNHDKNLPTLLDEAVASLSDVEANRLLDKVHQVQSELLSDIQHWQSGD